MTLKIPRFLDLLDEVIKEEDKNKKERFKDHGYSHNPSSASMQLPSGQVTGACLRQLYYRATKEPASEDTDTTSTLQAGFGDAIHKYLLDLLAKSKKITLSSEVKGKSLIDPLTKEISYRVDGLVTFEGELGGLEIKTVQGRAMTGKGWGIKEEGPKQDHLLQIASYFAANRAIKWFSLVYVARDSAYRLEYHITSDGDTLCVNGKAIPEISFSKIKERWASLEKHVEDKVVPPRDYKVWLNPEGEIQETKTVKGITSKSSFRCLYCPYSKTCWSSPDAFKDSYNGLEK